jgi:hypothetical protein
MPRLMQSCLATYKRMVQDRKPLVQQQTVHVLGKPGRSPAAVARALESRVFDVTCHILGNDPDEPPVAPTPDPGKVVMAIWKQVRIRRLKQGRKNVEATTFCPVVGRHRILEKNDALERFAFLCLVDNSN